MRRKCKSLGTQGRAGKREKQSVRTCAVGYLPIARMLATKQIIIIVVCILARRGVLSRPLLMVLIAFVLPTT